MRKLGVLTASAALVVVMGFSGTAAANTAVACGVTITSGDHTLAADLNCPTAGVTLRGVGTVLDLDGYTITCGPIQCTRLKNGAEIHGGNVIGGSFAVYLQGGTGNYVHDMHVTSAHGIGIAVRSTSSDNFIHDNVVTHSGGVGINAGTGGNEVVGNTVTHSGSNGISVPSAGNLISGNTSNHSASSGIFVNSGGSNTVEDNTTNHNGSNGIFLIGGGHVDANDNTANKNVVDGIFVDGTVDADLAGNVAFNNGDDGIQNLGTGTCPKTGPGKNKAKKNDGTDFIGCPNP